MRDFLDRQFAQDQAVKLESLLEALGEPILNGDFFLGYLVACVVGSRTGRKNSGALEAGTSSAKGFASLRPRSTIASEDRQLDRAILRPKD